MCLQVRQQPVHCEWDQTPRRGPRSQLAAQWDSVSLQLHSTVTLEQLPSTYTLHTTLTSMWANTEVNLPKWWRNNLIFRNSSHSIILLRQLLFNVKKLVNNILPFSSLKKVIRAIASFSAPAAVFSWQVVKIHCAQPAHSRQTMLEDSWRTCWRYIYIYIYVRELK